MGMRDPSCVLRLLLAVPALHCSFCFTPPRGMASKTVATLFFGSRNRMSQQYGDRVRVRVRGMDGGDGWVW